MSNVELYEALSIVEIRALSESISRRMLAFFIPVWAGTWATVVAVLLKG